MATVTVLTWKSNAWWGLLCTIYLCIVNPICHTIITPAKQIPLYNFQDHTRPPLCRYRTPWSLQRAPHSTECCTCSPLNKPFGVKRVRSPTRFKEWNIFNVFERWSHPDSACSEAVADIDCFSNILSGLISSFQFPNILQNWSCFPPEWRLLQQVHSCFCWLSQWPPPCSSLFG